MIVVSDSGPLISLMKAARLDLLRDLYGEIRIPEAVYTELTGNPRYAEEAEEIRTCSFVQVVAVKERRAVDDLRRSSGLDLGESEAILCGRYQGRHSPDGGGSRKTSCQGYGAAGAGIDRDTPAGV